MLLLFLNPTISLLRAVQEFPILLWVLVHQVKVELEHVNVVRRKGRQVLRLVLLDVQSYQRLYRIDRDSRGLAYILNL